MTDRTHRTVDGRGEASFEIRGSEFLGHVAPAADVEAAEAFVASVRESYADATHNVPAYRVPAGPASARTPDVGGGAGATGGPDAGGDDGGGRLLREWSSDDGEPSGSAGKPALNVLVRRDLRHVVAVVTRYYGGTNLGVGGLARAYARGVNEAVDDAGVVEETPRVRLSVTAAYDDSGTVRGILESRADAGVEFEADYDAAVSFAVRAPVDEAEALADRLRSATSGRVDVEVGTA